MNGANPAKVIRSRFDEQTVATLLNMAWWNWSAETITENLDAIVGCDLTRLIDVASRSESNG